MSCDKTADIAQHFVAAFSRYWSNCPYQIYFGVNNERSHLSTIRAIPLPCEAGGWRSETMVQIQALKSFAPHVKYVLVFLDDFILSRNVDSDAIARTVSAAIAQNISYLRLRSLEEGIVGKFMQKLDLSLRLGNERCFEIRQDHPYHSSLQVSLWRLDHLYESIERAADIWNFEKLVNPAIPHYSVASSLFTYRHVVEKGQWDLGAEQYCTEAIGFFHRGSRSKMEMSPIAYLVSRIKELTFWIFGYMPSRLRKHLAKRYP